MDTITLSIEAVQNEVDICNQFIDENQKKLELLEDQEKELNDRIAVLRAIDEKLPNNAASELTISNIGLVDDELIEVIKEKGKRENNIKHYKEILSKLDEIKSEL